MCEKYIKLMLLMTFFLFASNSVHAQTTTIVGLSECARLPSEISFMERPHGCSSANASMIIMFEAKNLIGFEEESLAFDYIKVNDQNYSTNRVGEPSYKAASFPKVTKDGKYGFLGVEIKDLPFGLLDQIKAKGRVEVLTSDKLVKDATLEVDNSNDLLGLTLGPITFVAPKEKADDNSMADAMTEAFFGSGFGGATETKPGEVSFLVKGYDSSVIKFEVYEGENKLNSGGWMSSGGIKQMSFSGHQGGPLTIKIDYWQNVKKSIVPINI